MLVQKHEKLLSNFIAVNSNFIESLSIKRSDSTGNSFPKTVSLMKLKLDVYDSVIYFTQNKEFNIKEIWKDLLLLNFHPHTIIFLLKVIIVRQAFHLLVGWHVNARGLSMMMTMKKIKILKEI